MLEVLLAPLEVAEDLGIGHEADEGPGRSLVSLPPFSLFFLPRSKVARLNLPSRKLATSKLDDSALTALVPTPLRPTENWNTSSLYLPPVLILRHAVDHLSQRDAAPVVAHGDLRAVAGDLDSSCPGP